MVDVKVEVDVGVGVTNGTESVAEEVGGNVGSASVTDGVGVGVMERV